MAIEKVAGAAKEAAVKAATKAEPAALRVAESVRARGVWQTICETLGLSSHKKGAPAVTKAVQAELSLSSQLLAPSLDLTHWKFKGDVEAGEKGVERSFWLQDPGGNMAVGKKSKDLMMTAHERMAYVMGSWLDLPVNKVQLGPYQEGIFSKTELISVHHNVGKNAQKAHRICNELGFKDSGMMDYRVKRGQQVADFVSGPSNWNLADGGVRYASIRERVVNPEIFDRIMLFDRLMENTDRHAGNYLVTPAGKNPKGEQMYQIHLIDHGRTLTWNNPLPLEARLAYFGEYLKSLEQEVDRLHLQNILPDLRRIASLSDEQLERQLLDGITPQMLPAETRANEIALLKGKRDQIRSWLDAHVSYLAEHFKQ